MARCSASTNRVVQLNRLRWRRLANTPNHAARALMAYMKVTERDRPRVKAECLRLMVTLKLNRARMRLIAAFVDTYLNLSEAEDRRFNRSLAAAKMLPEESKEVVKVVTSWERKGIEKGLQEGRALGRRAKSHFQLKSGHPQPRLQISKYISAHPSITY